jgi:hypothetical protein
MTTLTIKAIIRDGQLEVAEPIELPDETAVTVTLQADDDDRIETPEEIADWLRWYSTLQPFEFTAEERTALRKGLEEQKEFDIAKAEERARMLRRHFP